MAKLKIEELQAQKEKRYCKGCYADVTEGMFCYCGEFPLSIEGTVSQKEYEQIMDGYRTRNEEAKRCKNHDKHKEE